MFTLIKEIIPYIFTFIISIAISLVVEALKRPYPVTSLDHYIRIHFKKGKIKGSNLKYRTKFEIKDESIQGILSYLRGDVKKGEFYDLINAGMNGILIKDLSLQSNSVIGTIIIKDINAKLELTASKQDPDFEPEYIEENNINLEFSVTVGQWGYKHIKGLLYDTSVYQHYISDYLHKRYNFQQYKTVVEFETHKEPLILNYMNKINKADNLNGNITLRLGNDLDARFFDSHCEFVGVKTESDFEEILDVISWYV